MQKKILTTFIFILLTINSVLPDTWRILHENDGGTSVNDGVLIDNFHLLVAVGDSGNIYRVKNDGLWESLSPHGNTFDLSSIDYSIDAQSGLLTLMAVGSNGTVLRSLDSAKTWNAFFQGSTNYTAVKYASIDRLWFVGGENGMLEYSPDDGDTWTPLDLMFGNLTIKGFVDTYSDGFFLYGVKNDTTFILKWDGGSTFSPTPGDTIPNEIFTDAYFSMGGMGSNIYFCGVNAGNSESNIYKKRYSGGQFNPAVMVYNSIPPGATSIDGYETIDYKTIMWVTVDHRIYKSSGNENQWKNVYTNLGKSLKAIVANPNGYEYGDYGYALGTNELFLRYAFNLDWIQPDNNQQFDFGLDPIEMLFSSIPQLQSVENALSLHSSVSGALLTTPRYEASDSTVIIVDYSRPAGGDGSVPGEHLVFNVTQQIKAIDGNNSKIFAMPRDWDILSFNDSQIEYESKYLSAPIEERTTNFVTGFFNEDDIFDMITYSYNEFHCYIGNGDGSFQTETLISASGVNISPDSSLHNQLLTWDIDNDGKLDIILFDKNKIQLFKNESSGQQIQFSIENNFIRSNILQVSIDNINNNNIPDLRVMASDFFALQDINFTSFPGSTYVNGDNGNHPIMKLGDIDKDGWTDAVLSDENQNIRFMRGGFDLDFQNENSELSDGRFIDIQLADFNKDGILEVAALRENDIYIYKMDMGNWNFTPTVLLPDGGENLKRLVVHEFGGMKNNNNQRLMDVAAITQDGDIIFFENQSVDTALVFHQDTSFTVATSLIPEGIAQADFDRDAMVDPYVFNQKNGEFETFSKSAKEWKPIIYNAILDNRDDVTLTWSKFPDDMGTLEYYQIIRDTSLAFNPQSSFYKQYITSDTFYTDNEAWGQNDYWYMINAVYNSTAQTSWSDPIRVVKAIKINGDLGGFLDKLEAPYLVEDYIRVPIDSSLIISPGVAIEFEAGARFDVEGHLEVLGAPFIPDDGMPPDETKSIKTTTQDGDGDMVTFRPANWLEHWQGIYLHPSADTVRFEWFNIENAHTGITIDNRPVELLMGGITSNDTGLVAINDSLTLQNIAFDSNMVALVIENGTRSFIKNINLMNSQQLGLYAAYDSKTILKNAIIWNNNDNSIVSDVGTNENLRISYSTVDTVIGLYNDFNNIKNPPLFMPPDSGFFRVDYGSPTIDAGDPADDFSMEPMPNGNRINQGLFGGTPYATHSSIQSNLLFEPPYVFLEAGPEFSDTAFVRLTNTSPDNIHINAAYLKNAQPQFALFNIGQSDIPAENSIEFYITFSPDRKGRYLDTLVIDSNDPLAPIQFLPIEGNGFNTPPFVDVEHEFLFSVTNEQFSHRIPVHDIDDDPLTYIIETGPEWLSVTDEGILTGTPAEQDTGVFYVNVRIEDGAPDEAAFYNADIFVISSNQLLEGPLSGILDSTLSPYIVRSNIFVPDGESLQIEENTKIIFFPNTQLDIYGSLELNGTFDKMIAFSSFNNDSLWAGIRIHPGPDTLKLHGFVFEHCDTAFSTQGRALDISLCGMINDKIGFSLKNNSAQMKNVYIDSVGQGMIVDQSNVDIKNITIINSKFSGLNISAGSDVTLRNGILWNNQTSIVSAVTAEHLSLSYSTIDNIQGAYSGFEISNLAPVINPPEDDGPSLIDPSSPTVDAGDPADDFIMEPEPNGGRINQGAFGGTEFATPSFQGRIILRPDTLEASAYPGNSDTLYILVKNAGGMALDISAVNLTQPLPEFTILADAPPYSVAPLDSIIIPVRFSPQNREIYLDTLIFTSNDPHYLNGEKFVPIRGTGLNHAPIVVGNAPQQIRVENEYYYQIRVFDAENDILSFTSIEMPSWLSLSDSGAISGTPALSDTGINHIEISINDGHGGFATFEHNIMVWITDDYAPNIIITSRPPLEVRESAVHFEYYADDTTGYLVGDNPELLYMHYRLISLSNQSIISEADSIKETALTLYPLDDGNYEFQIWAYDTQGNGLHGVQNKKKILFNISSSKVSMNRLRWYMVSFPRSQTFNLKQLNEDSTAIILRWSNKENGYLPPENFEISMGEAFWIQSFKPYNVDLSSFEQTSKDDSIFTHIERGWNQVGIPLGYKVNWKETYFVSDSTGARTPLIDIMESKAVYWYLQNKKFQGYAWEKPDTAIAYPWRGYWIKSSQKGTVIFPKTPAIRVVQSLNDSLESMKKSVLAKTTISNWQLNLTLSNDNYIDKGNIIGVSNSEQNDLIYEPPHFGDFCSLYFTDAKGKLTQKLKSSFENYEDVLNWDFQVKSTETGKTHLLKWDNEGLNKLSLYVYLIDPENEKIIDMNNETSYTFTQGTSKKTFKVYATQDASFKPQIIPLEFKLQQNYPNPFNPTTTIRFGLPESLNNHKISVKVFDILGREVATLLNEKLKMGYHEVKWDGRNNSNIPAASGIYFYQVKGGSQLLVKKMVLMR